MAVGVRALAGVALAGGVAVRCPRRACVGKLIPDDEGGLYCLGCSRHWVLKLRDVPEEKKEWDNKKHAGRAL